MESRRQSRWSLARRPLRSGFPYPCTRLTKLTRLPTGHCKQCKRGFNQACVEEQINGVTRDGGCTPPFPPIQTYRQG